MTEIERQAPTLSWYRRVGKDWQNCVASSLKWLRLPVANKLLYWDETRRLPAGSAR